MGEIIVDIERVLRFGGLDFVYIVWRMIRSENIVVVWKKKNINEIYYSVFIVCSLVIRVNEVFDCKVIWVYLYCNCLLLKLFKFLWIKKMMKYWSKGCYDVID